MGERITIDQLKSEMSNQELPKGVYQANSKFGTAISVEELAKDMPKKEIKSETWEDEQWKNLDNAIDRFKREMTEFRQQIEEQEMYEQDLDEETVDTTASPAINRDDLEYDDSDEMEETYTRKIKLEDNVTMEPKVEIKETVMTDPPQEVVREMPVMRKPIEEVPVEEKMVPIQAEAVTVNTPVTLELDTEAEPVFMTDDDFDDDDEDSLDTVTEESENKERIAHVRSIVKEAYEENIDKIDVKKFTIAKKPVSVSNALASASTKTMVADWVLHSSGTCISVSQLSGPEIEALDVSGSNAGMYNAYLQMFKVLYKHVENPNKGSLEQWLRTISFYDMQDLYFAFYRACFGKDNHILYSCDKCKETYMRQKPIEEMVVFKNDEVKAKCKAIIDKGIAGNEPEYNVDLVQITNDYVVGIRVPSMYDATLGPALLPDEWRQKHSDLIGTCTFIDAIYRINRSNSTLEVISTNPVANDDVKSMKNRLKAYNKILSTFSSREYAKLKGVISNLGMNIDDIEYQIPGDICKKCGAEIPKQPMDPLQMLFTYHQLGQAAYISEN